MTDTPLSEQTGRELLETLQAQKEDEERRSREAAAQEALKSMTPEEQEKVKAYAAYTRMSLADYIHWSQRH